MWEALREATDEEMERDPTVCVMGACLAVCTDPTRIAQVSVSTLSSKLTPSVMSAGEDVGHYGGSYKVTLGLYKKYGEASAIFLFVPGLAPPSVDEQGTQVC